MSFKRLKYMGATLATAIGSGSFGQVYLVEHADDAQIYAMKCIRMGKQAFDSGIIPENPFREIQGMRALEHPNVLKLFDVVPYQDQLGLILEFMNSTLAEILESSLLQLDQVQVKRYMYMMLKGLAHCHEHNIMHRDIKPSNLLVNENDILKIGDFGLCTLYQGSSVEYTPHVATRWYRAPELLYGCKKSNMAIDLWAAGAIFAELHLSKPLFPGDNDLDQLARIFAICGSIEEDWPDVKHCPDYAKVQFRKYDRVAWQLVIPNMSHLGADLLSKLLHYNPNERITAKQALLHEYFFTDPLPDKY